MIGTDPDDRARRRERSAWSNRSFRWLFSALTVSTVGSEVTALAVPLVAALTLRASPVEMGLLAATARLPTFLVSLVAGVVLDRIAGQRRLMVVMDLLRAALLVAVPASLVADRLSMPLLFVVTLLVGTASVFHEVAQNAVVPRVVERRQLLDGNARLQASYSAGESAGPGIGGLLVQAVTAPVAVLADALSYLGSALLLTRVRTNPAHARSGQATTPPVRAVTDGLRALLGERLLGPWVRWGAVSVVFMGAFDAQFLFFASRTLDLDPAAIGLVAALGGVGAALAAVLMGRITRTTPAGRSIVGALMAYFVLLLPVSLAGGSVAGIVVVLALAKLGQSFSFTISNVQQWSLRQLVTPHDLLGRVAAGNRFLIGSAETFGAAVSGLAVQLVGVRTVLALTGVLGVLVLLPLVRSPLWRLHRLPQGVPPAPAD